MNYSFIKDIISYLENNFTGQLYNLILFFIGLFVGVILFIILFFIVYLISKRKNILLEEKEVMPINENYKNIISLTISKYQNNYSNLEIKEKAIGVFNLGLEMLQNISTLYYPNSKDAMFELSIEQLVDLLEYFVKRLDYSINRVLEEKIPFVNDKAKNKIKEKKLSAVFEMINKKNSSNSKKKNNVFTKIKNVFLNKSLKIADKITKNALNSEIIQLLNDFGEDINLVYSNQELKFKQLSKKQMKALKKKKGSGKYE